MCVNSEVWRKPTDKLDGYVDRYPTIERRFDAMEYRMPHVSTPIKRMGIEAIEGTPPIRRQRSTLFLCPCALDCPKPMPFPRRARALASKRSL